MWRRFGTGIGIVAAAADSIGYRAPARYQSNPRRDTDNTKKVEIVAAHLQDAGSTIDR